MVEIAPGWESDVDRGPDWLFVKLKPQGFGAVDTPELAEPLWKLLEQHSLHRLVLELDNIEVLFSHLIGQLVLLHKRIAIQGGTMRLCGLSPQNGALRPAGHLGRRNTTKSTEAFGVSQCPHRPTNSQPPTACRFSSTEKLVWTSS